MKDRVKETVLDLLEEICGDDVVREDMDVNLLEEDLIDSLDYTELLVGIEDALGVVMAPSELKREEVRAVGGLVFIQRKPRVDDKRDVVMHGHVDGILQSVDLQKFRIVITGSIDCIIEFQQFLLLTEYHLKQSGLIGTVWRCGRCRVCSVHMGSSFAFCQRGPAGTYP